MESYNENNYFIDAPMQSLRLLMYADQKQYCGNDIFKRGAGFMFQVHDVNTMTEYNLDTLSHLAPGYSSDVAIRRVLYKRSTESLNLCTNNVPLYMFPNINVYKKSFCYAQCAAEISLQLCKCYPLYYFAYHNRFQENAFRYNLTETSIKACLEKTDYVCLRNVRILFSNISIQRICSLCKEQCLESRYELLITKKLLSKSIRDKLMYNIPLMEFFKNYLLVQFYFEDMNVEVTETSQAFTLKNLFIYFGGNICLFLGMSFITLVEVVELILQLIYLMIRRHDTKVITIKPALKTHLNEKDRRTNCIELRKNELMKLQHKKISKIPKYDKKLFQVRASVVTTSSFV